MKYGGDEKKRGAFLLGNGHSDQNLGSRDGGQICGGGGGFSPLNFYNYRISFNNIWGH